MTSNNQLAIQQGVQFAQSVTDLRSQIDTMRTSINQNVDADVAEANNLIDDIAKLNPQITSLESAGLLQSDAGSLRDQRYADLNRLSQIIPVTINDRGSAGVDVSLNGQALVIPGEVQHLQTVSRGDRGITVDDVTVQGSTVPITGTQGELAGLINGRDNVVGGFLDQLDKFTSSVINQVNLIHSSGQGAHGYTSITGTNFVSDPNAALDAAGLAFPPQNGSFQVQVINTSTGLAQTGTINVDLAGVNPGTTLNDVVNQLNGLANVTASVTSNGNLQINAANGYQIEFSNDNSGTLAALGINTFFTGSSSLDIGVNSQLTADPTLLAAAQGGGPGDGTNATAAGQPEQPDPCFAGRSHDRQFLPADGFGPGGVVVFRERSLAGRPGLSVFAQQPARPNLGRQPRHGNRSNHAVPASLSECGPVHQHHRSIVYCIDADLSIDRFPAVSW